ncbi:PLP-dependent aminotransferase family protein [Streptomyces polygonati]|uniref:PLP-dependent aminotransferase family protein n=1 Tax=Streptomyces polygonati TaxID=1617087 RepID=A0ABV8HSA0_9ACTN
MTATPTAAGPAAPPARAVLSRDELHGSLSDPLLDQMTFLNEVTLRYPDAVSFAPGRPYEGLFDPDDVPAAFAAYLAHLGDTLGLGPEAVRERIFQYGRTKGFINDLIAGQLRRDEGISVDPEAIVVTAGAQEAMLLVLRALCAGPDDVLLVASPCYVGITGAARLLDIAVVPVPEAPGGGLDPEALAQAVRDQRAAGRRPRACYLVPDFANPSGASLSVPARRRLLDVAAETGLLLIEDDPYGFFALDGRARPTLKALDTGGRVIHIGSYAKTCFPGARIGYVIADQAVAGPAGAGLLADELAKLKSMTTVNTSALGQAVVGGMLLRCDLSLRAANQAVAAFYADNLRTVLAELAGAFPPDRKHAHGVSWNLPEGGFFVVVGVPFTADEQAMERCAREHGVLWTPMAGFYPAGGGQRLLRLSCSYLTTNQIRVGIERLAAFIAAERGRETAAPS